MPTSQFGSYPGYVDPLLANAQQAYWGTNLPKLEKIKHEIDPKDVFHNPQSVRLPGAKDPVPLKPATKPAPARESWWSRFLTKLKSLF